MYGQKRFAMYLKPCLVFLLCILLAACSATRLVYNQLDWGVVWYLNGFFSLDDKQETALRDAVMRNLEWHRTTQLPEYARYLRELDREMGSEPTPEMLEARYWEAVGFWDEIVLHTVPDVAAFFALLSDEQIDDFLENLDDDNSELWDEYAGETPEMRIERRENAAIKNARRVIGSLDDEQEELIRTHIRRMIDNANEWMIGRRIWQIEFVALIRERPPEPEFSERLTDLMLKPNQFDTLEYREKVATNRRIVMELVADLVAHMNEEQRVRLSERLMDYSRDFEILSVQGG
jgi:hypothetical protein